MASPFGDMQVELDLGAHKAPQPGGQPYEQRRAWPPRQPPFTSGHPTASQDPRQGFTGRPAPLPQPSFGLNHSLSNTSMHLTPPMGNDNFLGHIRSGMPTGPEGRVDLKGIGGPRPQAKPPRLPSGNHGNQGDTRPGPLLQIRNPPFRPAGMSRPAYPSQGGEVPTPVWEPAASAPFHRMGSSPSSHPTQYSPTPGEEGQRQEEHYSPPRDNNNLNQLSRENNLNQPLRDNNNLSQPLRDNNNHSQPPRDNSRDQSPPTPASNQWTRLEFSSSQPNQSQGGTKPVQPPSTYSEGTPSVIGNPNQSPLVGRDGMSRPLAPPPPLPRFPFMQPTAPLTGRMANEQEGANVTQGWEPSHGNQSITSLLTHPASSPYKPLPVDNVPAPTSRQDSGSTMGSWQPPGMQQDIHGRINTYGNHTEMGAGPPKEGQQEVIEQAQRPSSRTDQVDVTSSYSNNIGLGERTQTPSEEGDQVRARQMKTEPSGENQQDLQVTNEQQKILEDMYKNNAQPDEKERVQIGTRIGLPEHMVALWFNNRQEKDRGQDGKGLGQGPRPEATAVSGPPVDPQVSNDHVARQVAIVNSIEDGNISRVRTLLYDPRYDPITPGLTVDAEGHSAIHWAAALGQAPMLEMLIKSGEDVEMRNIRGHTPLMRAVMWHFSYDRKNFAKILDLLRSTLSLTNQLGQNCLQVACANLALHESDRKRAAAEYYIPLLLKEKGRGLDIDHQDNEGNTALSYCVAYRTTRFVRLLHSAGANAELANAKGQTALSQAQSDKAIFKILTRSKSITSETSNGFGEDEESTGQHYMAR
eukprot:Ihof_evm9s71 gene=Ihof_evmTU9s71